jgi:hypothetical protein
MGELMLDLLGLLGVIVLALLAAWGGFALLTRLLWRSGRENVAACATQIAEALALSTVVSPDARMLFWHGPIPGRRTVAGDRGKPSWTDRFAI